MSARKITPMFNDYVYEAIRRIAVEQGFTPDLFSVDFDEETRIECDGFVSFVFKAIINGDDREFTLWCKVPPNDDPRSLELFKRECFFYREILHGFYDFQSEKGVLEESDEGFFATPRCYLAHCDTSKPDEPEALIMLEYNEAYEKWDWDKLEPINVEHTKLVMQQLGRLHALSFAMKEQRPELFTAYKRSNDVLVEKNELLTLLKESFDRAIVTMKTRFEAEQDKILAVKDAVFESLKACCDPVKAEPYCVVTHGDCWINNLIYSHNENNVATSVVLTDWQSSRYASPILDLCYFFFISSGEQFRRDHMDSLLHYYHGALAEFLEKLGGDATKQFPLTTLLRLMKPYRELLGS
ncbi:Juvenile hormone-inducible protein [Anopheles darlingi]|uniref:Juvenile hormone-inducible protein n=1 Tax=Anopheles darlingi TaxID=43151 RepID=W5JWJ9_ANODA|nr:Juvenile hormone-inducible protein [Anopheles darlingi]